MSEININENPTLIETNPEQHEQSLVQAEKVAAILDDKKALDIKLIRVDKQTIIADYFVIAGGTSSTHIRALADEVEFKLSQEGIEPARVEGLDNTGWILMDYSSVIVHIFNSESRDYFKLEKLWSEGEEIKLELK